MKKKKITTYKGFDSDLKCRNHQYEAGKEYSTNKPIGLCEHGFHSCENPFDAWIFYPPADSRYAECEVSGKTKTDEIKIVSSKIKIKAKFSLHQMIQVGIDLIFSKVKKTGKKTNSGDRGAASNSGDRGAASNSGYRGAASNSGYSGAASNSGYSGAAFSIGNDAKSETNADNSFACAFGINSKAKASKGSWIILAEWEEDENYDWHIKTIKSAKIDGKKLKADTFYKLEDGKFVEAN